MLEKVKGILLNSKILLVVKATFTFFAFLIYFKVIFSYNSYNFFFIILYFYFFTFYNKYDILYKRSEKENKILSSIFSVLISFILIIGSIVSSHVNENVGLIFNFHNIIYSIIGIIGFYLLFRNLFILLFSKLPKIVSNEKQKMNFKVYLIIVFLFLLFWLPYFLRYFPAVMTPDSYYMLHYVQNGELNDLHVFVYTWFVGLFYLLGNMIFHNSNLAVSIYTIVQMVICAFVFAYIIKFLFDKQVKKVLIIILTIFMLLSPLFAFYSITLWRDVLFGMAFVTLFISLYKFVADKYKFRMSTMIMYLLSVVVILFFRNNGIYVFLLFIPLFSIFTKKRKLIITGVNLLIVIMYFVIKGPIFDYFGVTKTKTSEAFSIPLQQISRVLTNNGDIDNKTYKYITGILDVQTVRKTYDPTIADYVKRATDNEKLSKDKLKFLKAWFIIGVENPKIYIESYLCSTLGYWYPDVVYWATAGESKSNFEDVDVYSEPIILKKFTFFSKLTSRKIPLSNLIWSIGTMFILLLISTMVMIYKHHTNYLLAYMPLYCLWATLMLATPVFSELRYVYALFTCMPLVLFAPFICEIEAGDDNHD